MDNRKRARSSDVDELLQEIATQSLGILNAVADKLPCDLCRDAVVGVFGEVCDMYGCTPLERQAVLSQIVRVVGKEVALKAGRAQAKARVPSTTHRAVFAQDSWREWMTQNMRGARDYASSRSTKTNITIIMGVLITCYVLYLGSLNMETLAQVLDTTAGQVRGLETQLGQATHLSQQAVVKAMELKEAAAQSGMLGQLYYQAKDTVIGVTSEVTRLGDAVDTLAAAIRGITGAVTNPMVDTARYLVDAVPSTRVLLGVFTAESSASLAQLSGGAEAAAQVLQGMAAISSFGVVAPLARLSSQAVAYIRDAAPTPKIETITSVVTQKDGRRLQAFDAMVAAGFSPEEAASGIREAFPAG